ncbi:hypothetical protein Ddye_021132 [Dipteronia dyeriana]|uniref:DUF1985 domain-containing protein n=1 Tax=Dipteronia dyeriana TaxID=168575 RepID=A0AAD9U180_9ROSI|nr:hypothetical protein Ddye_021132 [Dipteronia dyeriana]
MTSDVFNLQADVEFSRNSRLLVPNQPPRSEAAIFQPFGSNFSAMFLCRFLGDFGWKWFKCVLKENTGNMLWQPGPDWIFQTLETENTITIREDWGNAEYQKLIIMSGNKLLESLKINKCDRFPSRVTGHCNWESIRLIKSHLTEKQLKLFRVTCFGHFLDVSDMVLSGHFCHHILLRECHVKNTDYNASSLWYHVGNGLIRFSPVEFFLVSGLAFGEYSESNLELFKRKNSRLRRIYFQSSKVKVKMIVDWFRNLGSNNKISDDEDVVKLALILFLEMTLVRKDDRTSILYWALELVDDLDAFNNFPWGTFIYSSNRQFLAFFNCIIHGLCNVG